jgi:hypothetical protein
MAKPVTPQDMFDMWSKMVNPGAYPLQSLMFPVLDAKELQKKIAELETVEHWLKANVSMVQLSIQSLQYQLALLKGGEKFSEEIKSGAAPKAPELEETNNPALWAWNMMANAGKGMMEGAAKAAQEAQQQPREPAPKKAKTKKKPAGEA